MLQPVPDQLPLKIPGRRRLTHPSLIQRVEGSGNYSLLYLTTLSQPLLITRTLKYFEEQLPGFMRVSKTELINPAFVTQFVRQGPANAHLTLRNGTIIGISRRRILPTQTRLLAYQQPQSS